MIDIRRGIDLLAARSDVDARRIAYVGHGYGANWGAILSAIEPRLCAFALVAGFPSLTELMDGDDPEMGNMRFALGNERFARYKASMSAVDLFVSRMLGGGADSVSVWPLRSIYAACNNQQLCALDLKSAKSGLL